MYNKKEILIKLTSDIKPLWPVWAKFSYTDFLEIISKEGYSLSKELSKRGDHISKVLDTFWVNRPKSGSPKICNYILSISGYKHCPKCHNTYNHNDFYVSNSCISGYSSWCKTCYNTKGTLYRGSNPEKSKEQSLNNYQKHKSAYVARNIAYKTRRSLATPPWANLDIIKNIYECAEGAHVDHIIPLQNALVCGLHVESNLQYLTPEENRRKSNTFEILTE